MDNSFDFEDLFDSKKLAEVIAKDKNELAVKIKEKVRSRIGNLEPASCISFQLYDGSTLIRNVNLEASKEYARVLIAFMNENTYNSYRIESQITPVALKAAEEAILEFYSGEKVQNAISKEITRQLEESQIIQTALKADLQGNNEWLKHEFNTIIAGQAGHSLAGQSIDALASSMTHFFSTAVGKAILLSIGKMMGTQMGHMLLRYIAMAVSKAMATTAFRAAVVTAIKKIGIGILIKTIIGKAIIALLAMVGISGIPVLWLILPIIAGVLYFEYTNFPTKLSEKLPDSISDGIISNFDTLNLDVSNNIVAGVAKELIDELTQLRKDEK
jgi:hypothetical protein